jgi:hypothetical protein
MAFEIHRRAFFDPEDDAEPEGKAPAHWGWRILSFVVIATILIGLGYLFIGSPASGPA